MKVSLKYIVIAVLLLVGVTFAITRYKFPKVVTVTKSIPVKIDSNLWVARSEYQDKISLLKELKIQNASLEKALSKSKQQIVTLTQINGRLHLGEDTLLSKLDSLHSKVKLVINSSGIQDTTYFFNKTFGDSLIRVTSQIGIHEGMLSNYLNLNQLRPIKIDVATTQKNNLMFVYVSSPDMDIQYTTKTTINPFKHKIGRFWYFIGGGLVFTSAYILLK